MRKAIFFFIFFMLALSVLGANFVITKDRFPTISVAYNESEIVNIITRNLIQIGINKEYELIDNSSNPIISDPNLNDGLLTYTFLFKPKTPLDNGQYILAKEKFKEAAKLLTAFVEEEKKFQGDDDAQRKAMQRQYR